MLVWSTFDAVPAGEVMDRDDVFGITHPCEITIGTTIIVVRLPGTPPTECLSRIGRPSQRRRWPESIMARVSAIISSRTRPAAAHAVMNDARWMSA